MVGWRGHYLLVWPLVLLLLLLQLLLLLLLIGLEGLRLVGVLPQPQPQRGKGGSEHGGWRRRV